MNKKPNTILSTLVPAHRRGDNFVHVEHDDETAMVGFDKSGKITELHTPQVIVKRIHETMHMRLTDNKRASRQYKKVPDIVGQIVEDVRIHVHEDGWPWPYKRTPKSIAATTEAFVRNELAEAEAIDPKAPYAEWRKFAGRFRAAAVLYGMRRYSLHDNLASSGLSSSEVDLAYEAYKLIHKRKEGKAAELLATAYFPPPPPPEFFENRNRSKEHDEDPSVKGPKMTIVELPHVLPTSEAACGVRRVVSGPRLDRRVINRPQLPVRCFLRRQPTEPGGTVLIDASGSMGDFDEIRQWAAKAPAATVAYYAGSGSSGQLFVYARNGYRAREAVDPRRRGNTIDGPALTWLMAQRGPRVFVTDRAFCGAADSNAQIVRLANYERQGLVTVVDYSK